MNLKHIPTSCIVERFYDYSVESLRAGSNILVEMVQENNKWQIGNFPLGQQIPEYYDSLW